MSNRTVTLAELSAGSPLDLGVTDWYLISQERVDAFAEATEDRQWIHVDPDAAGRGPFGHTIAHGYLTLSLVPRLLEELLVISDQTRGTNYGLDRVRFTNAVPVGSRIRMSAAVSESTQSDDGSTVRYRLHLQVDIEDEERPAMVAEVIYLASNAPTG